MPEQADAQSNATANTFLRCAVIPEGIIRGLSDSYIRFFRLLAPSLGFEPRTCRLTAGRSSQLSYDGIMISDVFDLFADDILRLDISTLVRRSRFPASIREQGFEASEGC